MNKKREILYLAVSADDYELPVAVFDSIEELAIWDNCSTKTLKKKITHHIMSNNCFFEAISPQKTKNKKIFNT